jgi:hypothetical protein
MAEKTAFGPNCVKQNKPPPIQRAIIDSVVLMLSFLKNKIGNSKLTSSIDSKTHAFASFFLAKKLGGLWDIYHKNDANVYLQFGE